jgi:ABC-2 type transport system ATP-binding protein
MAQPIVKIRGVSKSFGQKLVLDSIDLDINEGEIFGIIGASGAGKTTLLESLIGFFPTTKGEIAYRTDDHGVFAFLSLKKDPRIKQEIGFASQEPSFYERLTVKENLAYFATLYDIPRQFTEQRIKKIIDLVELTGEENTLAGELSGGMQKRLDIACSLINDPKILILDEPTADLDPLLRKHIWRLVKKINSLGKTVIISSHFLDEIESLCHRIAIIHDKTVAHIGTAEELRRNYAYDKEVVVNLASQNYQRVASLLHGMPVTKIVVRNNKMVIYTKEAERILKKLIDVLDKEREDVLELEVQRPPLDEIFASIISRGAQ